MEESIIAGLTARDDQYACALANRILSALRSADLSGCRDSMRPLIEKDIADTIKQLTTPD